MNKKYVPFTQYVALLAGIIIISSCDRNFEELNVNPNASSTIVPEYVFTKALYDGAKNSPEFLLGTMQYTTSFNDVAGFGSKYVLSQQGQSYLAFNSAYPNEINELSETIRAIETDPAKSTQLAQARIWKAYCFSRLTDLYGDIPYSQAGKGYVENTFQPTYDPQKDIYADLLKELDEAAKALDNSKKTFGNADLIYSGNTEKWKKFAYSIMLRLGMRMTKVDVSAAQTWVTKAIAGGVIRSDDDIAKIPYIANGQLINRNPLALRLWNDDYIAQNGNSNTEGGKYQDVFINYLKNTNDPRLGIISIVYNNGVADTAAAIQKGMPANLSSKPANFATLSEPNPKTFLLQNSPKLLFTLAESYFLLTEAATRGWYNGATAAAMYDSATTAAMRQWSIIAGAAGIIPPQKIEAYRMANPFNSAGTLDQKLQQIYTQFWVSIFPDAQEVFSQYRRTNYPALVPNNYPGNATGGKIFRRMLYPASEQNLNTASFNQAVNRQGANEFLTRIWWDKQ